MSYIWHSRWIWVQLPDFCDDTFRHNLSNIQDTAHHSFLQQIFLEFPSTEIADKLPIFRIDRFPHSRIGSARWLACAKPWRVECCNAGRHETADACYILLRTWWPGFTIRMLGWRIGHWHSGSSRRFKRCAFCDRATSTRDRCRQPVPQCFWCRRICYVVCWSSWFFFSFVGFSDDPLSSLTSCVWPIGR